MTVRADEAQIIRDLADRYLAGESLRSLATWLDEQGVVHGRRRAVAHPDPARVLASGRIAGLRDHQGQVIGQRCGNRSSPSRPGRG